MERLVRAGPEHQRQDRGCPSGTSPYHDDAPVSFEWYDIRSGRKLDAPPILEDLRDKNYATIAVPSWSRRAEGEGRRYRMVSGGSKAR